MGLFNRRTEEEKRHQEIGRFLLPGEEIELEFGNVDKAFITNKRVIFKDISVSFTSDLLEMVFIPLTRLDGVSYVEMNKMVFTRAVRIKSRGFSHDMGFAKAQEDECIQACQRLSEIMLRNV